MYPISEPCCISLCRVSGKPRVATVSTPSASNIRCVESLSLSPVADSISMLVLLACKCALQVAVAPIRSFMRSIRGVHSDLNHYFTKSEVHHHLWVCSQQSEHVMQSLPKYPIRVCCVAAQTVLLYQPTLSDASTSLAGIQVAKFSALSCGSKPPDHQGWSLCQDTQHAITPQPAQSNKDGA